MRKRLLFELLSFFLVSCGLAYGVHYSWDELPSFRGVVFILFHVLLLWNIGSSFISMVSPNQSEQGRVRGDIRKRFHPVRRVLFKC